MHFHSPDIRVGDHLFVKEQTADRTCREETKGEAEEGRLALTAWMKLVMWCFGKKCRGLIWM